MPWNDIWQADMDDSGLLPLIKGENENEVEQSNGYLVVDLDPYGPSDRNHDPSSRNEVHVLTNVHIKKKKSYELVEKLFDKYIATANEKEVFDTKKISEIEDFLNYAINTEPMKVARNYLKNVYNISNSDEEWIKELYNIWFEPRRHGSTSVFEHVFLGEQSMKHRDVLDGHHFWYNYYLNDGPYEVTHHEERIFFLHTVEVEAPEISHYAEVITISYNYLEKDRENQDGLELHKETGGFFVGISAECLLAFGTVAYFMALPERNDSCNSVAKNIPVTINGETYNLKVIFECDEDNIFFRTFYPMINKNGSGGRAPRGRRDGRDRNH
ncbi:hypothetical protein CON65_14790 [Bacillus pseudomycoides]|uniref:EndoU domain-containing protein n=2 Tax=Bacillus TaxID=1386 RepID=A0AA91VCY2_9BACI|nr:MULTISPECIES: hypothetical protein [Bacillus]PEB50617.1 hypothetical protein COO03_21160 [Bacillus sp. AFS098217]PED81890.1 hypothetical protein CON65_14790 [Bacillus pseudomycoides]PEU08000.1 hypothetical protein CN524_19515 [Bacillus sp. AFS019443]PEU14258.1 hypothetical protein CN525_18565 [Bacillus sp. AFS014408]PFW59107.1 hypothetical protein COL20_24775 [Bacillus sp. AFS075034]